MVTGSRFAVRRSPHPWRASQARHQYWSDLRCQVHGAAKATSLARLENVPAESRRRDRLDRPIRGSDDLISAALWITRAGPRPETHPLAWRHRTSECRMALCKLVKPAAGTPRRLICFVIGTASTARHIPVGFERWAFATDRLRHDRRGKTV